MQPQQSALSFTATAPGVLNAVAFWFDLLLLGGEADPLPADVLLTQAGGATPAATAAAAARAATARAVDLLLLGGEMQREGGAPPAGGVNVTMDRITKPHALASGKGTFSDGETAEWMLDQTGRLGLVPGKPGYRPSETDVMAFQRELQRVAQGFG